VKNVVQQTIPNSQHTIKGWHRDNYDDDDDDDDDSDHSHTVHAHMYTEENS